MTLRHPRAMLAVAAFVLLGLGVIGTGVEDRLEPTTLSIPGTQSERSNEMLRDHFGASMPFAILLRGPAAELDRQGPELIRALRQDPKVTTLSPWDRGSVVDLRPSPRRALILADFHTEIKEAVNETVPQLNQTLEETIHQPVRATQTGFASISRALQERSIAASERGELLAFPFLLIVLLLVFRSPIAAAIPLGFGAITVVASRGILYLAASWFDIDAFALTVCSMMGLALGVDYALLMVSRFREELASGLSPFEAARMTRRTAGRTTVFAGSTLMLSMIVSIFILPGSLLASLAGTLVMVVALTVLISTLVAPPVLALLGPNVDRWRIGAAPNGERSRLMTVVSAALRRPILVSLIIGGVVLVLAAPAIGLKTGPPSPEQLPQNDEAREDAELIAEQTAPGYEAPYSIVAATDDGAITDAKYLDALDRFQHRLADLPGVQAVVGPSQVASRVAPLQQTGNAFLTSNGNIGTVKQLGKLSRNLKVAAGGVEQLRGGIEEASDGAGLLAQGSGRVEEGAQKVASGLARAASGGQEALGGLDEFAKGADRLSKAQDTAAIGALQLQFGIQALTGANLRVNGYNRSLKAQESLEEEVNKTLPKLLAPAKVVEVQLKTALSQLQGMTVGQTDPNYGPTLDAVRRAAAALTGTNPVDNTPYAPEYTGLPKELEALQARLVEDVDNANHATDQLRSTLLEGEKLARQAKKLTEGLREIAKGGKELAAGAKAINDETHKLVGGLDQLSAGAVALVGGIDRLGGGAEVLEDGLTEVAERTAPLQGGLERGSVQVLAGKHRINRQARQVKDNSPNLFNSGYFVLSALDGSTPEARERAGTTIDLSSGQAATMLVISKFSFNTPGSIALNKRLDEDAEELAEETGLATGVAGNASQLNDYSRVTKETIPTVVAAITIATFLILILVLRAIPLAALAVGLNLVTVGVAFGVLTLLSNVPADWPLGGREYIDAVGAVMIFGIVFGLSIDYAVFLLIRMREHYEDHGDNAAAIEFGLEKTARVITGAAVIMMAVFIAFAGSSLATVSQLGVGLTVAVILDATVVRIVLLPALMLLMGDRVWWLPRSLDRLLPKFDV